MKINARKHLEIRLQNLGFVLLFLGVAALLGWLSTRHVARFDWTESGRHTLTETSRKLLDMLEGPIKITAYVREEKNVRESISDQIGLFSAHKKDLSLSFINPDTQPDKVRDLGIRADGTLLVEYKGRQEQVVNMSEAALSNALQRLAHAKEQHLVFLEGHGERSPKGKANHDLGQFGEELQRKGIQVSMINLAVTPDIPDNTDVLALSAARVNLLPGEIKKIQEFVEKGGNLLWLADPGALHGLEPLAVQLGLKFLPGVVVDASTQLFGIDDPSFALVAKYPPHPITMGFDTLTLFPVAAAMVKTNEGEFERTPFLTTLQRSWTETGPIEGNVQFGADKNEHEGPLDIGFALSSEKKPDQRIVVIGDGDFLSNAYLGNGGNLNLAFNIVHWLSRNEAFIDIPVKPAKDRALNLSPITSVAIAVSFLFLLPAGLIGTGAFIWFKRRRR